MSIELVNVVIEDGTTCETLKEVLKGCTVSQVVVSEYVVQVFDSRDAVEEVTEKLNKAGIRAFVESSNVEVCCDEE